MITLHFTCGHTAESNGNENSTPTCPTDGSPLERVSAPAPTVRISRVPVKIDADGKVQE